MAATQHGQGEQRPGRGEIRATVVARLPNAMFRVRRQDGSELLAHVAGDLRMAFTRLCPGDVVIVEPSAFDPWKGRIVDRAAPVR